MAGRPKKIQEDETTQVEKVQPILSEPTPPAKVAPVITERAQPKITQVSRPVINNKKWYLVNKQTGNKAQMSQNQAQRTATKYPQQFSAIYE